VFSFKRNKKVVSFLFKNVCTHYLEKGVFTVEKGVKKRLSRRKSNSIFMLAVNISAKQGL